MESLNIIKRIIISFFLRRSGAQVFFSLFSKDTGRTIKALSTDDANIVETLEGVIKDYIVGPVTNILNKGICNQASAQVLNGSFFLSLLMSRFSKCNIDLAGQKDCSCDQNEEPLHSMTSRELKNLIEARAGIELETLSRDVKNSNMSSYYIKELVRTMKLARTPKEHLANIEVCHYLREITLAFSLAESDSIAFNCYNRAENLKPLKFSEGSISDIVADRTAYEQLTSNISSQDANDNLLALVINDKIKR